MTTALPRLLLTVFIAGLLGVVAGCATQAQRAAPVEAVDQPSGSAGSDEAADTGDRDLGDGAGGEVLGR
jgi:hypothetical protein